MSQDDELVRSFESTNLLLEGDYENYSSDLNPDRSLGYILTLTVILGALQMAWTVEFSEGTPYLLYLGISKQLLALVWIAGPLSGIVGQPIVGILSDNSDCAHGRRRPFIWGGWIAICATLGFIAYSENIVGLFMPNADSQTVKTATLPFASVAIYVLDFSIASFQAASRALIVDLVPTHQQQISNAWAARMIGLFNILGYFLGATNIVRFAPGGDQLKALTFWAVVILSCITVIATWHIKERNPQKDPLVLKARRESQIRGQAGSKGVLHTFTTIYLQTLSSISKLSPQVKLVNYTEFMAWIGYFPMLFYTTTYVGELYIYEKVSQRLNQGLPPLTEIDKKLLVEQGTRKGATALLVHSISSLIFTFVAPFFVAESPTDIASMIRVVPRTHPSGLLSKSLSVKKMWSAAHLIFVLCMASTFVIKSSGAAILMFAFLGIPWGCALWAPFVLIAEEISSIKEKKIMYERDSARVKPDMINYEYESGIILGIHNVFVSAPQVVSSLFSSLLFLILSSRFDSDDKFKGQFDDSLQWVFRFGGFMAAWAFILSLKVQENH